MKLTPEERRTLDKMVNLLEEEELFNSRHNLIFSLKDCRDSIELLRKIETEDLAQ
jgi:hypothetical protein